jgi:hypothetical protein
LACSSETWAQVSIIILYLARGNLMRGSPRSWGAVGTTIKAADDLSYDNAIDKRVTADNL